MNKSLAFIDLLGFGNMVKQDHKKAKIILNDFYNLAYDIIKNEPEIKGNLFSDSLLAYSDDPAKLVNTITKIFRECLKRNSKYLLNSDLKGFFLLPRGGISRGVVNIENRHEAPNLSKDFIISPALVHSAKMESTIKGSRLLIAENNDKNIFNWNNDIETILYKKETFIFWENFNYFDALWFLDTSKKNEIEQKNEIEGLIEISFMLIKDNENAVKAIFDQHIETLRIALLSYTKFLRNNYNNNIILNHILTNYIDDKYWVIWLTIIEVIMQLEDKFAICKDPKIINFYKTVSLKKSWIEIIKEINIPKNTYLKEMLAEFIEESFSGIISTREKLELNDFFAEKTKYSEK